MEKNLGRCIAKISEKFNAGELSNTYSDTTRIVQRVIDKVNSSLGIRNTGKIKTISDLTSEVDLFILAAGSGSRFRPLAEEVAALRGRGEQFNKISIPFELGEGKEPFTMLEWALAMGKCFTGKEGYQNVITKKPLGSFADIVMHYLSQKSGQRKIKDIVVLCGDNIFGNSSEEMLEYVVRTLNSGKQLGVVGVARKPHEVAGRFGVLDIGSFDPKTRLYSLNGFVEKPPIEVAKKMVNEEGNNAANTGMFVMGRESLEKLLKIIKEEIDVLGGKTKYIAKSAIKRAQSQVATLTMPSESLTPYLLSIRVNP